MTPVNAGPIHLEVYDSIFEMPPHREMMMNYYMLSEVGIGHDWNSIDQHFNAMIMTALSENEQSVKVVDMMQHIENLKINIMTMVSKYNPEHMAWLCLVHSVDGVLFTDVSEESLEALAARVGEHSKNMYGWQDVFAEIRKKFPPSWQNIFPAGLDQAELLD